MSNRKLLAVYGVEGTESDPILAEALRQGCSMNGAKYVSIATNPFCDYAQEKVGYPDTFDGMTNVSRITSSVTVPTQIVPYDCNIWFPPVICTAPVPGTPQVVQGATVNLSTGAATAGANAYNSLGAVCVIQVVNAGAKSFDPAAPPLSVFTIPLPQLLAPLDQIRVISMAYKVQVSSSDINSAGMAIDWNSGVDPDWTQVPVNVGLAPVANLMYQVQSLQCQLPPQQLSVAEQITNARRRAVDGSLCIAKFGGTDRPIVQPHRAGVRFWGAPVGGLVVDSFDVSYPNTTSYGFVRETGYHSMGSYYTGLSALTTLNVEVIMYVEQCPRPNDPLVALATPSPAYDPKALALVDMFQSKLVAGYPVNWNSTGKFTAFLKKIGGGIQTGLNLAAPILQSLPDPRAQAAGAAIAVEQQVARAIADKKRAAAQKKKNS